MKNYSSLLVLLIASTSILFACSGSGGGNSAPAAPGTDPGPQNKPVVTAGRGEITVTDIEDYSMISKDEYANTDSTTKFKCYYDKRQMRTSLIISAFNPSAKVQATRRVFALMSGNFIIEEGRNELQSRIGNTLVVIDDKEPKKDLPPYETDGYGAADDGCGVSVRVNKGIAEGTMRCSTISLRARKVDLEIRFRCDLEVLQ